MTKMIGKSSLTVHLLAFFWLVSALTAMAATVSATVSSQKVSPNQPFEYFIQIENGTLNGAEHRLQLPLQIQQMSNASVSRSAEFNFSGDQKSSVTLRWVVSAREPGEFVIPPQTLKVDGADVATNEIRVKVESSGSPDEDPAMGFILELDLPKKEIYQGEVVPLLCKLYIPRDAQFASSPRLIEIEKSDFAVARFPQQADQATAEINGVGYYVLTYRSTLSSLKAGDFKVGPASQVVIAELPVGGRRGQRGFPSMFGTPTEPRILNLKSLPLSVKVLALPTEGKPENFSGAVGDFTMTATATPTELTVGDPIAAEIIISGTGNFDALTEPALTIPQGWKTYPSKRYSIEGQLDQNQVPTLERKIGYSQVFIPEAVQNMLPPFEINYFSSKEKKYVTLRTNPIELNMKPAPPLPAGENATVSGTQVTSAEVLPPVLDPQVNITDIVINPPTVSRWALPAGALLIRSDTFWSIQAVPVGLLIFACVLALLRRQREARQAGRAGELRAAWRTFEKDGKSEGEFLRAAARFIHSSKAGESVIEPELKAILDRYQASNFTADKIASSVSSTERRQITSELSRLLNRSLAKVVAFAVLLLACGNLNAQTPKTAAINPDEIYQEAVAELEKDNYPRAQYLAESLLKKEPPLLSPEVFQLIGHARYRQGDLGRAALWYQRAQLLDMRSSELKQNVRHLNERLRYLSFSEGSVLRQWSLSLTSNQWVILAAIGGWLILLPLAWWIWAKRPHGGRVFALSMLGLAMMIPAGLFATLRPLGEDRVRDISVIILPETRAYTAATVTAGSVIDLPPGSQVRILEKRGKWVYVQIPNEPEDLLGWVEEVALSPLWAWDAALIP